MGKLLFALLGLVLPGLAGAQALPVSLLPSRVVLGQDPVVVVRVTLPPGAPPARALRAAASTGRLLPQRASRPDEALYTWTPPDIRYPLMAVLAFWTEPTEGPPDITRVSLPLLGRNELTVDAGVGAQVMVEVAGQSFGPSRADRRGKARVTVLVPPGGAKALVRAALPGQKPSLRTIPLDVPPEQPLLAVLSPGRLPRQAGGWLLLMGEQPVPGSALRMRVRGASTREQAPGVFLVKPEPGASAVSVEATRTDGTGAARVTTPVVDVVEPPPPVPSPPPPPLVVPMAEVTPALVLGPVRLPPPRPPPPPLLHPVSVQALAGAFFAGGDNRGPLASLGVGYQLPLFQGRFFLEAEAALSQSLARVRVEGQEGLGTVDSRLVGLPVLLSLRGLAFEHGLFSLHGRVGAGPTYYTHRAMGSFFDTPLVQSGRTVMGFLAAQADWHLGPVSALLEVRVARAAARAPLVEAQLGGVSTSVGLRFRP